MERMTRTGVWKAVHEKVLMRLLWIWILGMTGGYDAPAQDSDFADGSAADMSVTRISVADGVQDLRTLMMFWNLENFFDPFDDPLTSDEEFLPQGYRHWTWKKFVHKRNLIAKTILSVKDVAGIFPAIIGFAEVENRMVLSQLVSNTALVKLDYRILHRDSPDRRGIDVALIYREEDFLPVCTEWIPVSTDGRSTRDILHVKGVFRKSEHDSADIFVIHWPSKFGGEKQSLPLRMTAARILHEKVTSLNNSKKNIIVMGDFNDIPESAPVWYMADSSGLTVMGRSSGATATSFRDYKAEGTLKYKGKWELIDNFLLYSDTLVRLSESIGADRADIVKGVPESRTSEGIADLLCLPSVEMIIFNHPMLLEKDQKYLGHKPFRTYYGPRWNQGVSDHLPILLLFRQ